MGKKINKAKLVFVLFIISLWIIAILKLYPIIKDLKGVHGSTNKHDVSVKAKPKKENTKEEIFFKKYAESLYSEYYDILNVSVYDYIPEDEDCGSNEKFYFVAIEKRLKFNSVYQLPFVAGMKKAVENFKNNKKALNQYNKRTTELKKYIGKKQIENNIFKITFTENDNFENIKIEIATYHTKIDAFSLKPPEPDVMMQYGFDFIKRHIKTNSKKIDYNNSAAVNYANKYSSNPLNMSSDISVWNDDYNTYENDCANYVSQCIYAGGIRLSGSWYPDSLIWIRTGSPRYASSGITTYMQKKNLFYSTNYSSISEGGFICLIKESHVVFVTSNDSITILFNGHTNDRKLVSFPHLNESEAIYLSPNN
ncbi:MULTISPECIES: amidase domain-containing protein [unclassified Treponema]|uniref:amidase domain-containing protein n=1 Tax=unclassified Treponema TaxID=2638727 RepID=UPI0020A34C29|nr:MULTISPECIES: amidase domain-containing protein [unclassified Treponema]UTC67041.1 amidase domain-containing protein [Treponema sp. OMZ 789]UTC69772.1 amidase domain-containing protein [Treponema sp. OMZ 790]UTC72486.1 amidase domain-containing protein [Treponema sp. OMZ 791]